MTAPIDLAAYLAEFDDIPGTTVFTAKRARAGYHMNQFAMSLMKPENRTRWKADERAYLDEWKLSDAQKQAILDRDYNRCLDLGGNIYFLAKLFSTDGQSFLQAVSTMTGMTPEAYQAMMVAGGRSPEGMRSIRGQGADEPVLIEYLQVDR
ncbi:protocatechuate 4,5-dioxygenase subunit alpha [Sphingobium xenophagum]|uniref:protocatechuate 4,5-dioxygenase subunit alpha n=1 Tax=Sphingobium xenophagum TaxID=121428 RepID=UPI0002F1E0BD|nr:protocatechuate 4,5-dioxygenase subunit alpha [Sphingobium xenophagum]